VSALDTFRDALALYAQRDYASTDAVLASDEMQAIRKIVNWAMDQGYPLPKMPYNVFRWALDDPSPDSPADKPCETCGGSGRRYFEWGGKAGTSDPCPSCRGGEPT
jgi:hypothetical protein